MRFINVFLSVFLAPISLTAQEIGYQDAVLVRFGSVSVGANCNSSGTAHSEADGDNSIETRGTTTTGCSDIFYRNYTIRFENHDYVLAKASSKKGSALGYATLGWSHAFQKDSVLANLLPGSHVQVRTDAEGFHVRVGKRESLFKVVAAQ